MTAILALLAMTERLKIQDLRHSLREYVNPSTHESAETIFLGDLMLRPRQDWIATRWFGNGSVHVLAEDYLSAPAAPAWFVSVARIAEFDERIEVRRRDLARVFLALKVAASKATVNSETLFMAGCSKVMEELLDDLIQAVPEPSAAFVELRRGILMAAGGLLERAAACISGGYWSLEESFAVHRQLLSDNLLLDARLAFQCTQ